jgi:8-oxo-dGTP pyrophosphatase MutT (NUDIX family)
MRTIEREIVGGFIFSNDGYMLLGKSKPGGVYPGYSMVPGGGLEKGEAKLEALRREILEETALDIRDAKIELINESQFGENEKTLPGTGERVLARMHFNDFHVVMSQPARDLILEEGDDFAGPEWIPIRSLSDLKLTEPMRITLRKLGYL